MNRSKSKESLNPSDATVVPWKSPASICVDAANPCKCSAAASSWHWCECLAFNYIDNQLIKARRAYQCISVSLPPHDDDSNPGGRCLFCFTRVAPWMLVPRKPGCETLDIFCCIKTRCRAWLPSFLSYCRCTAIGSVWQDCLHTSTRVWSLGSRVCLSSEPPVFPSQACFCSKILTVLIEHHATLKMSWGLKRDTWACWGFFLLMNLLFHYPSFD